MKITRIRIDTQASLRGLHVVNGSNIWASGSEGTIVHSGDGGKTWKLHRFPSQPPLEYRDIHGFSDGSAITLSAGSPALFYRKPSTEGDWKLVFSDRHPGVFFDAVDFWDNSNGIAFSDPLEGNLLILQTDDGGRSWKRNQKAPAALKQEAGFAASGTCITTRRGGKIWIGLGGKPLDGETGQARVIRSTDGGRSFQAAETTLTRSESAGVFSLAFANDRIGVAVGGDYRQPARTVDNCTLTRDGGKTWQKPKSSLPSGFRSCVAIGGEKNNIWLATGTNGTDISFDAGDSWKRVSDEGFHAISFIPGTDQGWACGGTGKLARFSLLD